MILEMGMLIGIVSREKCIILRKSGVEMPSDIQGLIYLRFEESVEEIQEKLRDKLNNLGFQIK